MKVTAYLCDCGCGNVYLEKDTVGLIVKPPELFDTEPVIAMSNATKQPSSFEITNNVEKTSLHFSMSCHRKHVIDLLKEIDRSKNEADYTLHFKLYSTKFYEKIYTSSLLRNNANYKRSKKLLQPLGKTT